jgi:hypothetical protein
MPKDEFDFDDPLELNGVALLTEEDTTDAMCECFIEEFMRMGYGPKQILALFRNPHYLGMNMVLERRGEPFIRDAITETFARWGRPAAWPAPECRTAVPPAQEPEVMHQRSPMLEDQSRQDTSAALTDPMGAPVPNLNL